MPTSALRRQELMPSRREFPPRRTAGWRPISLPSSRSQSPPQPECWPTRHQTARRHGLAVGRAYWVALAPPPLIGESPARQRKLAARQAYSSAMQWRLVRYGRGAFANVTVGSNVSSCKEGSKHPRWLLGSATPPAMVAWLTGRFASATWRSGQRLALSVANQPTGACGGLGRVPIACGPGGRDRAEGERPEWVAV